MPIAASLNHGPDHVVGVIEPTDEVAKSLRSIGGKVENIVKCFFVKEAGHERVVGNAALDEDHPPGTFSRKPPKGRRAQLPGDLIEEDARRHGCR